MENLALLILSGGLSERFQEKKAFIKVKGKPLIKHVAEKIPNKHQELIISCKTGQNKLEKMFPNAKIIKDKKPEDGPMIGLLSSLPHIKSEYVAILSCDCPRIKTEVINMLYKKAETHSAAVPRWPEGFLEPLVAVYQKEELESAVQKAWDNKEMKLSKVIEKLDDVVFVSTEKIKEVDPELDSFINLNTPEKLREEFDN